MSWNCKTKELTVVRIIGTVFVQDLMVFNDNFAIVYDFNNLDEATLRTVDTFSIVNSETKFVRIFKRKYREKNNKETKRSAR